MKSFTLTIIATLATSATLIAAALAMALLGSLLLRGRPCGPLPAPPAGFSALPGPQGRGGQLPGAGAKMAC